MEYKEWLENDAMEATVTTMYKNAKDMLEQREEFENQRINLRQGDVVFPRTYISSGNESLRM